MCVCVCTRAVWRVVHTLTRAVWRVVHTLRLSHTCVCVRARAVWRVVQTLTRAVWRVVHTLRLSHTCVCVCARAVWRVVHTLRLSHTCVCVRACSVTCGTVGRAPKWLQPWRSASQSGGEEKGGQQEGLHWLFVCRFHELGWVGDRRAVMGSVCAYECDDARCVGFTSWDGWVMEGPSWALCVCLCVCACVCGH